MKKYALTIILTLLIACNAYPARPKRGYVGNFMNKGNSGQDVTAWGATGDGVTDDHAAFEDAIAAAAITGGVVMVPNAGAAAYKIEDHVTVPLGVTIYFADGAFLSVDNTKIFAINGTLEAGIYMIFSGAGTITLAAGSCEYVVPQWWGAVGDDSTDNHTAIEAAITAMSSIGKLYIPPGIYQVSAPIDNFPTGYTDNFGTAYVIEGSSPSDTIIKYTGLSDFAFKLYNTSLATEDSNKAVNYVTIRDLKIDANSLTSEGGGIWNVGGYHNNFDNIGFDALESTHGVGIKMSRRNFVDSESTMTNDTDRDFTTSSGGANNEAYAIAFTTPTPGTRLKTVTVRLGKTGAPAGTIAATIYSDAAGPNAIVGGASATVANNALSANVDGADQQFTFTFANGAALAATTKYWVVLQTAGYVYANGVTEVRLRVDAGDGAVNFFATFDDGGPGWATSNDGFNYSIDLGVGPALWNFATKINNNDSPDAPIGILLEDDSQLVLSDSNIKAKRCVRGTGSPVFLTNGVNFTGSGAAGVPAIDFQNSAGGLAMFTNTYMEGGGTTNPAHLGNTTASFANCEWLSYIQWNLGIIPPVVYGGLGPYFFTDDQTTMPPEQWRHRIMAPFSGVSEPPHIDIGNTTTIQADAAALTGFSWDLPASGDIIDMYIGNAGNRGRTMMPTGTYLITIVGKVDASDGDDMLMVVHETSLGGAMANTWRIGWTTSYLPYYVTVNWDAALAGNIMFMRLSSRTVNMNVSHIEVKYLGPSDPKQVESVLFNTDPSDADGARESRVIFAGIRANDITNAYLGSISAFHDGAAADDKGRVEIRVNDGTDELAPSLAAYWDSLGDSYFTGNVAITGDISSAGGFKQPFSFMQTDVAANQTDVQIEVSGLVGNTEYVMPYAGSVIAVSIASNAARTAGIATVEPSINGAGTGFTCELDDAPTTYNSATQAKDTDAFGAGDRLGVEITTDGAWAPVTADIVVTVIVEM